MADNEQQVWILVPRRLVQKVETLVADNPPSEVPFENTQGSGASRRKSLDKPLALTSREIEVAYAVARGLTNAEICEEMGLRYDTVKDHVTQIRLKLNLPNRLEVEMYFKELMERVKKPANRRAG